MEEDVLRVKEEKGLESFSPRTNYLVKSIIEKSRLLLSVESIGLVQAGPVKELSSKGVEGTRPVFARFMSAPSGM